MTGIFIMHFFMAYYSGGSVSYSGMSTAEYATQSDCLAAKQQILQQATADGWHTNYMFITCTKKG